MGKATTFGRGGRGYAAARSDNGRHAGSRARRRRRKGGWPRHIGPVIAALLVVAVNLADRYPDMPVIRDMIAMVRSLDPAGRIAEPDRSTVTAAIDRHFSMCRAMPRRDCVVDGDTFYYGREKVRIADIDTPEIFSPRCSGERRLGLRASERLHGLLNAGPIQLASVDRDRDVYGRLLRVVSRDGRSLGDTLVAEGLAHRWIGHKQSWCG